MKLAAKNMQRLAAWHSTLEIFGEMTPQPEIQITPLPWRERAALTEAATEIKAAPHPTQPNGFVTHEHFNPWKFNELLVKRCVTGLKYFEDADGRALDAARPNDIEALLTGLDSQFVLWLQTLIIKVCDDADTARSDKHAADLKN